MASKSLANLVILTLIAVSSRSSLADDSKSIPSSVEMKFVQPPAGEILGKNDLSVKIECVAYGATKVTIRCGDEAFLSDMPAPPLPTMRTKVAASAEIERKSIERKPGKTLECFCVAENATYKLNSESATLQIAYLKKNFPEEPHPVQRVRIGNSAEICAQVPEGLPEPDVNWAKDGKVLDLTKQEGVLMTRRPNNRHCLIFSLVTQLTAGAYTCVASNIATNRTSLPSDLKVYLDGGWSDWSSWSDCNITCGLGSSQRTRQCNQPSPVNDGAICEGESVELKQCTRLCQQDGGWSSWSEWNACNTQCVHHRTRKCNNPAPRNGGLDCVGDTIDHANCTGGHCNQNYINSNGRKVDANGNRINPNGGSPDDESSNRRPVVKSDDDIFLYTFAMISVMLLFIAIMASAMFLCFKKYKYICRITGPAGTCQHTLAMEAHHQSRGGISCSPSGLYVTKNHSGNVVTRILGPNNAVPPPDVTQTQQAIQILSDGTFYKTMFLEPASLCSGSPAASTGYRTMLDHQSLDQSNSGYPNHVSHLGNKRSSPTRCSSAGLYSNGYYPLYKTDTACTLLSDQSSVVNFSKQSDVPMSDIPVSNSRMYENTGSHYQSIKDIESDGNYMSTPFCQQHPADTPVTSSQLRNGVLFPSFLDNSGSGGRYRGFPGLRNSAHVVPVSFHNGEESDYFSQCSSDGCGGGVGGVVGGGFTSESDGTTYHIDLCRNTICADHTSCRSCDSKSCSSNRSTQNSIFCSSG